MSKLRVDKIAAPIVQDEFTGSVYFDGTGDYLSVADSSDFTFGTEDFTIEFWRYRSSVSDTESYVTKYNNTNAQQSFWFGALSNGREDFAWYSGSNGYSIVSANNVAQVDEWGHLAAVRLNGVITLYLNGVSIGSDSSSDAAASFNDDSNPLIIGGDNYSGSTYDYHGYISNLRVCKGHAVYQGNFTPPTRQLVVHKAAPKGVVFSAADNVTTLLACQSATDATIDASGRHTITANGDVHAQSANPGLLRGTNISTTITENTGAVFFDGTGDYLDIKENGNDFDFPEETTIESWIYFETIPTNSWVDFLGTSNNSAYLGSGKSGWIAAYYTLTVTGLQFRLSYQSNSAWIFELGWNFTATAGQWYHVVYTRESGTIYCYVNGVKLARSTTSGTGSQSDAITSSEGILRVGGGAGSTAKLLTGYISNVRICKGHAVYKSANGNFAVPTRELEVHQGPEDDRTTLLCCHDGENIFADKSGRHIIAAYGDRLSSPTPTATDSPIGITTHNPGLTRNVDPTAGPTFQGGAGYTSQNWLTLPKGTTAERMPNFATNAVTSGGTRAIYHSGESPDTTTYDTIEFLNIATLGNIADFGNLNNQKLNQVACSSDTRGLFATGYTPSPAGGNNFIDYVTIMSAGNAKDFGDLSFVTYVPDACSNQIRGIYAGGAAAPNYSGQTNIDYVNISTLGNGKDFGDLTLARHSLSGLASPTRGVFAGGNASPTSNLNNIDYITIASTGNAQDFGDLPVGRAGCAGASSSIRGLFGGGYTATPAVRNIIDFITISSMGNALDFGDLTAVRRFGGATSSTTRGVFVAGFDPSATNVIDYVSIQTTGNAVDFGDTINETQSSACSNGHGGLG